MYDSDTGTISVLVSSNAGPSALYEELIHYGQFQSGQFAQWTTQYGQNGAEVLAEFYAAQKLIQNQAAYGISVSENAENISRLNTFANQLTQMGIPH